MATDPRPYNPLDYDNLTRNCVQELMTRLPESLPITGIFNGAGVYALFYNGSFLPYSSIRSPSADKPIYVGKAVPAGGRKGLLDPSAPPGRALFNRLSQHAKSIEQVKNLDLPDFSCR
jgi:hypothetical protein